MLMIECVAFMLVKYGSILVERCSQSKVLGPGAVAIPGGHLEDGETPEDGVRRELAEELEVEAGDLRYVCSLVDQSQDLRRIHYYAIESWTGEVANNEADELLWVRMANPGALDFSVDRLAVGEFQRLYGGI